MVLLSRHGRIAMVFAVAVHLVLLMVKVSVDVPVSKANPELTITLVNDQPINEKTPPESADSPPEKSDAEPPVPKDIPTPIEDIIAVEPSKSTPTSDQPRVQVNINSKEFRQFLRTETDQYRQTNPSAISDFKQTFEPVEEDVNVVPSTSKEAQAQIRQNGVGMSQHKNGKRTCFAQIPDIVDSNAPPTTLSKDCTPPKKFILDLDRPRNN